MGVSLAVNATLLSKLKLWTYIRADNKPRICMRTFIARDRMSAPRDKEVYERPRFGLILCCFF